MFIHRPTVQTLLHVSLQNKPCVNQVHTFHAYFTLLFWGTANILAHKSTLYCLYGIAAIQTSNSSFVLPTITTQGCACLLLMVNVVFEAAHVPSADINCVQASSVTVPLDWAYQTCLNSTGGGGVRGWPAIITSLTQ